MAQRAHPSPLVALMSRRIDRRTFLRGTALAGGAVLLNACGGGGTSTSASGEGGGGDGAVSLGSNYSDQVPKDALAEALAGFDGTVNINTIDHNTYQEQINNYLQANPQDVFAWFAGYRMQFFAERGLASPITDVWNDIGGDYSEALKQASTAQNEQFFVPFYYYPWAVFYRKSVFSDGGYEVPTTFDEFIALADKMQADGIVPLAFADKDGWPAMGTFDYINMRTNGYDFHTALMAGDESWESSQVVDTFNNWKQLMPYQQENALGRTWQEAAQSLADKETGMYLLGMFVGQQFQGDAYDDLDFFAFPEINSEFGQDSVEAPIDGWMMSAAPTNEAGAKRLLTYLGGAAAQETYLGSDPNNIAANDTADTSNYNELQKKAVELVGQASNISQFMDRDTRPDFASTVMIPSLQQFLRQPDNLDSLLTSIEQQKQSIFGS